MYLFFFPVALSFALSLTLSTRIFLTEKTASNDAAAAARRRALEQLTGTYTAALAGRVQG